MKICAVLDNVVTEGGGFNQGLNAVIQMSRLCKGRWEFSVYTSVGENVEYLERLGIRASLYKLGLRDWWLAFVATSELLRRAQRKTKWVGGLEKKLKNDGVDLIYFVIPTTRCLAMQELNYLATVWDLCHRDTPEFPEVRKYGRFLSREFLYANTLSQSVAVVCDSHLLAQRIESRYAVDRGRLVVMPFAPSPFLAREECSSKDDVLKKYGLTEGYYFYPAQFWAHKNHARLLYALRILVDRAVERRLVFCGGNQETVGHVESLVRKLELEKYVRFLGFVPSDDMHGLYEGACAAVIPTYFGPTNLPPLEAWSVGAPLIVSTIQKEQVGEAALVADPDSPEEWAKMMQKVIDPGVAEELVRKGRTRLLEIDEERTNSELNLFSILETFSKRLQCWKI